jgi:hypothetical protein
MSSPLDRKFNPDEPSPYAPKWVRDAAQSDRRTTEPAVFEDAEVDGFRPSAMPDISISKNRYGAPHVSDKPGRMFEGRPSLRLARG